MKLNKFANLLVIGLILTLAASGCRKKPVGVTELPGAYDGQPKRYRRRRRDPARPAADNRSLVSLALRPASRSIRTTDCIKAGSRTPQALKAETVYFALIARLCSASEKPKVAAVADYLKANPGKAVRVEGNCDERGTEEYNRALGERRALAVREELVRLGVDPSRVDTISYGKDRPVDPGHDEAAWRKNRRDDFVVLSPPK